MSLMVFKRMSLKIRCFIAGLAAVALSGCVSPMAGNEPDVAAAAPTSTALPAQSQNPFGSFQVKVGDYNGPCFGAAC
jgi:hypothetical protein